MIDYKRIIEALLMVSHDTLSVKQLTNLLSTEENVTEEQVKNTLQELMTEYSSKGLELKELAGGYRFQICSDLSKWVNKLFEEKPPRYSRALLETLAIITYKQPVTRAEIENIRGVSISSSVIKTLLDREWIKTAGHKNVPGKPALYTTTKEFLNYFNLKSLKELPELEHLINETTNEIDQINEQLELHFTPEPGLTDNRQKNDNEVSIIDEKGE
jgi:segregation and condensation protein B